MTRIVATGNFPRWQPTDDCGRPYIFGRATASGYRRSKVMARSDVMSDYWNETELDLIYVANSLLRFEELARKGEVPFNSHLSFVVADTDVWSSSEIQDELIEVLSLALPMLPTIDFLEGPSLRFEPSESPHRNTNVTLFSGGADSVSGVVPPDSSLSSPIGLFVSHSSLVGKVEDLWSRYLRKNGIPLWIVDVQRSGGALQQLRGFLYLICGSVATRIANCATLVITESGPTMYQPQFVPNDEVTITTHPRLIDSVGRLVRLVLGRSLEFTLPFENMTKAEALAWCQIPESIPDTHSCLTSQFAYHEYSHCGRCYGCLVRRISAIVAGVPDAKYAYDVFIQGIGDEPGAVRWRRPRISSADMANLQVILRFSSDVLEDHVPDFTAWNIDGFDKGSLFRRFALDIVSAAYLTDTAHPKGHNRIVNRFLSDLLQRGVVTRETLEDRIAQVRNQEFVPNFDSG